MNVRVAESYLIGFTEVLVRSRFVRAVVRVESFEMRVTEVMVAE